MRFLIDMNLTFRWVQRLREAGHECCHWSEIGSGETPDTEICAYARDHDYMLVTNDLDFPQILAFTAAAKPSVVLLRGAPLVPELRAVALLTAIADCSAELEHGAILTLDWSDKVRVRLLPLR
jgi:predicted nuclease of predicted toxin-antitoxin system